MSGKRDLFEIQCSNCVAFGSYLVTHDASNVGSTVREGFSGHMRSDGLPANRNISCNACGDKHVNIFRKLQR